MKKLLVFSLVLLMALSACAPTPAEPEATPTATPAITVTPEPTPAALQKDLVVLYTNDVHCAVDEGIGYAGLAALKSSLEAEGSYVVLADAGDAIQGEPIGTISKGEYPLEIMNAVGYDVAIPGNHEFDYGMDQFLALSKEASFPYISANFTDLTTGKLVFEPYKVMDFDGVKIAFVGATTPRTITSSTPAYFQDASGNFIYGFCQDTSGAAFYQAVQAAVDSARGEGAEYVVLLGHLGISADTSPYTSSELIENTEGIDVVIDGHSHSTLACERVKNKAGEWTLLSQTGTKFSSVGMLLIEKDGNISTGLVTDFADKDAAVDAKIKEIQASFEAELNQVVATSTVDLTINEPGTDTRIIRIAETNLGDLCADAYKAASGADIAFVNGGGIRATIPAGDITYGGILSVHPYGNVLCVAEATGQEILDALEMGARALPEESGGFLQVAGLTYEIHTYIKPSVTLDENGLFVSVDGDYRVKNVKVGDADLDLTKTYTVACHDYLLKNGGDGYTMFQDNVFPAVPEMLDNQVLINYITGDLGGIVGEAYAEPYGAGRITIYTKKPKS